MAQLVTSLSKSLADTAVDVTDKLVGRVLNSGLNHIDSHESGLELHVRATENKLLEFVITNRDGCPVEETTAVATTTLKKTTCWKCGKDAEGNIHCWQIPCPVIVGPWIPGKVIQAALTLI